MSYYFLYAPKKISSVLAYTLIFLMLIGVGFLFTSKKQIYTSQASAVSAPENIQFGNITDTAATVSFTTAIPVTTFVKYGQQNTLNMIRFDDRDTSSRIARTLHYFTLEQLTPNTIYTITIVINGQEYTARGPLLLTTLAKVNATASYPPIFGKIYDKNLQPADNVLINVSLKKTMLNAPFTALSKPSGEWIVTFPIVMDTRKQQVVLSDNDAIVVTFRRDKFVSRVLVHYKNASPMKSIILGTNMDLTQSDTVLGVNTQTSDQQSNVQNELLIFPRPNTVVNSQYPVIRGVSKPNSLVQVTLQPPGKISLLLTNTYGEWKLDSKTPLLPGTYTVSVESKTTGQKQQASFLIGKSGESVLGEATPSASITPTNIPTAIPTPTIGSPTITPGLTSTLSPTPSPTDIPLATPTIAYPTPTVTVQRLPSAGAANTIAIVAASGLSLLGLFLVLY